MNIHEKANNGSQRFRYIKLCVFLSGLSVFAQLYLFQPLLPIIADHFKTSVGNSSLLVSSSTIGMAIGLFFFAFKADSYSRKNLMTFSLLTSSLLTIISAYIPNMSVLIIFGVLKGFIVSGVSAVTLAYITEEVDRSIVPLAISMYLSGNIIGGMSGRILSTILAGEFGWENSVLIIGIESLLLGILFWIFFPDSIFFHPKKIDYSLKVKQMKKFLQDAYMLHLYLIAALLMGAFISIYNYLTFRLESAPFHLNHFLIAFIFLMYIFGVLGTMITSKLSKNIEQKVILKSAIVTIIIGSLFLFSENIYMVTCGLGIFTLSFFAAHTIASQMTALHAKEGKSSATSIYWLFYYLGSSILGSSTGYILHSTSWNFFILFIILIILITFLLSGKNN
ncbi:MFS transporter [Chryseobacterium potabilaquae]|uniref:Inner membrane transport protein YnfM n=1 Tax=Chryseobacterium potabilaquae TaxID=2675057 RepID=A0A6N4X827_9FLAO|nr:MFS transporter [Chryseobacterium potabilaquae]CAA7197170.1 Inner membrane transport protein YnfM [Chryseobacterium potabilaquae]